MAWNSVFHSHIVSQYLNAFSFTVLQNRFECLFFGQVHIPTRHVISSCLALPPWSLHAWFSAAHMVPWNRDHIFQSQVDCFCSSFPSLCQIKCGHNGWEVLPNSTKLDGSSSWHRHIFTPCIYYINDMQVHIQTYFPTFQLLFSQHTNRLGETDSNLLPMLFLNQ